jgi:hypothetical protein
MAGWENYAQSSIGFESPASIFVVGWFWLSAGQTLDHNVVPLIRVRHAFPGGVHSTRPANEILPCRLPDTQQV